MSEAVVRRGGLSSQSELLRRFALLVGLTLVVLLPPALLGSYELTLLSTGLCLGLWAVGLDVLVGGVGLLSFGHALWFGMGGYVSGAIALHLTTNIVPVLALTMLALGLAALLIGLLIAHTTGVTFAILTLLLAQIAFTFMQQEVSLAGGENGLIGLPLPTLFGYEFFSPGSFYMLCAVVSILGVILVWWLRRSKIGATAASIRANEDRAAASGVNVRLVKALVLAVSAAVSGAAGCLLALQQGGISPASLYWAQSGLVLVLVIVGGSRTLLGPLLAGVVYQIAYSEISGTITEAWQIPLGLIFIAVVMLAPGGIGGILRDWRRKRAAGRARGATRERPAT